MPPPLPGRPGGGPGPGQPRLVVGPAAQAARQAVQVTRRIQDRVLPDILRQAPLAGRVRKNQRQASQHVGESLVCQAQGPVEHVGLLQGETHVIPPARVHHRVGGSRLVMNDPKPGRRFRDQPPQTFQVIGDRQAAKMELAGNVGQPHRPNGVLQATSRTDRLAEPVEPKAIAGAGRQIGGPVGEGKRVVHGERTQPVGVRVRVGNRRAPHREERRVRQHRLFDPPGKPVGHPGRRTAVLLGAMEVLEIQRVRACRSAGRFGYRGERTRRSAVVQVGRSGQGSSHQLRVHPAVGACRNREWTPRGTKPRRQPSCRPQPHAAPRMGPTRMCAVIVHKGPIPRSVTGSPHILVGVPGPRHVRGAHHANTVPRPGQGVCRFEHAGAGGQVAGRHHTDPRHPLRQLKQRR